ncbi:octaprenyl-diphosphate synthase [Candidatus Kryptonium thompsonii]|uniref:Octaprenyl-diphosphate synthase n=2 Tax=Candidatus Kryptonium thompsonii TaxID=1633631 RepID=A0A0P1LTI6_9BACT|nr:polyprenyl synthetase family protein [Candidatus Kryptonium thompsoni]CUS78431.1 octaprenyl-diphosphate synthase [Candidatus Kryptonium thompsoni]CUS81159.1 octaprenyl-diphosphate synthase [Candidatus Kryptonium thompsoni]CUS81302.1 octaprenyl-diphosphate synthase [Candidatus Kryptonium thompsoni]CUS82319.1 octaprenyl-diphosphate synthase [Candidatus Kryptonium thompsoni]CUS84873.1 octaprenyl-diphosphate synthase [Candidatus Kryptonium thompsoni]
MNLTEIIQPIKTELLEFERFFKKMMFSKVKLLNIISHYILRQKGKRIRPTLVFLSAKLVGDINESTFHAATLVELLHTATLIHDDVVDESDMRRGFPSLNSIWGNKVAVLVGDFFLAQGLLLSLKHKEYRFLHITSEAVRRMSEGELLEIQTSRSNDIDEEVYFRIISDKTASLISACCELGAASTTDDEVVLYKLKNFGENLGIAFQLRDDLLDYMGETSITGKPVASDIRDGKITLPLIYALKNSSRKESRRVMKIIKNNPRNKDIFYVIDFVKSYGGIDYTLKVAEEYLERAKSLISDFSDSLAKASLLKLADFVLERVS